MKELFSFILFFLLSIIPAFGQIEPNKVGNLPSSVSETSGLLFYNNKIITHNDSGNSPKLYEIDSLTLKVTRIITVSNAKNIDWEDLAQDETYIYIGDIGNNKGVRHSLTVYRILKDDYRKLDTVRAEAITFSYEDQINFENAGNSDWDAEAMFVFENQLFVLTKQWQSNGTVAYTFPIVPGNYNATKLDAYPIGGLITSASYNPESGNLLILGYSNLLTPFLYQIKGLKKNSIFNEKITNLDIRMGNAQVEGITYISKNKYFISSEFFERRILSIEYDASLYSFSFLAEDEEEIEEIKEDDELLLYSKFGEDQLFYQVPDSVIVQGRAVYDITGKRINYVTGLDLEDEFIDTSSLKSAIYFLAIYGRNGIYSKAFIKN